MGVSKDMRLNVHGLNDFEQMVVFYMRDKADGKANSEWKNLLKKFLALGADYHQEYTREEVVRDLILLKEGKETNDNLIEKYIGKRNDIAWRFGLMSFDDYMAKICDENNLWGRVRETYNPYVWNG